MIATIGAAIPVSEDEFDCSPKTSTLNGDREMPMKWIERLGELIDNGFDAGAKRISIELGDRHLRYQDDGVGCAKIQALFTMGDREDHGSTLMGRYGRGAKSVFHNLYGVVDVESVHDGVLTRAFLNIPQMQKSGSWALQGLRRNKFDGPSGMRIVIRDHDKPIKKKREWYEALARDLGSMYMPAVQNGLQIVLQPLDRRGQSRGPAIVVRQPETPEMKATERLLDIDGKKLRVRFGILEPGVPNPHPGFRVFHHYRRIETLTLAGVKMSRVMGEIWILDKSWRLAMHKDQVTDRAWHKVSDEIRRAFDAEIRIAEEKAEDASAEQMVQEIQNRLRSVFGNRKMPEGADGEGGDEVVELDGVKEKRSSPRPLDEPAHSSTGYGKPREFATNTQPGSGKRRTRKPRGKRSLLSDLANLEIEWYPGKDDNKLGYAVIEPPKVFLNEGHSLMGAIRERNDVEQAMVHALWLLSAEVYVPKHVGKRKQLELFKDYEEMTEAMGVAMRRLAATGSAKPKQPRSSSKAGSAA